MKKYTSLLSVLTTLLVLMGLSSATLISRDGIDQRAAKKVPMSESVFLKVTVGHQEAIVPFINSETTRDFIKLLPVTLTMDDLGKREKYSSLPQELSKKGAVKATFQKGDLAYWLGGGLAAFYNQDDHEVKAGLIVLARLEKGIDLFSVPGSVNVKFEAIKKQ